MLYIKSISIPEVNKFYSICFQGFNDRFYYMDTSWKRHSCPIEDVTYEAYFGARYKSGTKEAYLVDERLAHEYIKSLRDEYIKKLQATKRDTL